MVVVTTMSTMTTETKGKRTAVASPAITLVWVSSTQLSILEDRSTRELLLAYLANTAYSVLILIAPDNDLYEDFTPWISSGGVTPSIIAGTGIASSYSPTHRSIATSTTHMQPHTSASAMVSIQIQYKDQGLPGKPT